MSVQRFELPVAVTLRIQSRSGNVDVFAEPRDDVEVQGEHIDSIADDGGATLRVRDGRGHKSFSVRCPIGTDVTVGTQSGGVRMHGEFGIVSVTTMNGNIEVDHSDEADLRSISGSLTLSACRGRCRLNSGSGSVTAGRVGAASAGSMSGSIKLARVDGSLKARSVSGSIEAACAGEGAIAVKTVSGKVHIELPAGVEPQTRFKTISGRVRCTCHEGSDVLVEAMSVSGSIEVVPR